MDYDKDKELHAECRREMRDLQGKLAHCEAQLGAEHHEKKNLEVELADWKAQAEAFKPVAARVAIQTCIECRREYPQWSVLSGITCPDCKSKRLVQDERDRCGTFLGAEGKRAMDCGTSELAGVFWALEIRIRQGDKTDGPTIKGRNG